MGPGKPRRGIGPIGTALCCAISASCTSAGQGIPVKPEPNPASTPNASEILSNVRAAMLTLSSFEVHVVSIDTEAAFSLPPVVTDYRFEPPDRHSWVVHPFPRRPQAAGADVTDSGSEARRIGTRFWTRESVDSDDWTCKRYNIEPPALESYVPPAGATLLGVIQTSLGSSYRFRHEYPGQGEEMMFTRSDYWIDPTTSRVTRIEHVRYTSTAVANQEIRLLDKFDSPSQIVAPNRCLFPEGDFVSDAG